MPVVKVSNNKDQLPKFVKVTTSTGNVKVFEVKK
jgi:hypothetical protein